MLPKPGSNQDTLRWRWTGGTVAHPDRGPSSCRAVEEPQTRTTSGGACPRGAAARSQLHDIPAKAAPCRQ